jgi:hypothetical protein
MTDHPTDDPLLRELRRLANRVDPVPDEVTAYARAALGWRRIDAELAELLVDSRLAAGAARGGGGPRSLTFRASDLEVAVELEDQDGAVRMLGQLAPAGRAAIDVQRDDGSIAASAEADELGRFRVELAAGMRVRLVVRRASAQAVETSWIDA